MNLENIEEESNNIIPTKMDLNIIYEDDFYLVINKGPNTATHPSFNHYDTSLSNGVKYYFDSINLKRKIRPVNRLDKDTSGIIIFAKSAYIQECLIKQMKSNLFIKSYIAVVSGILENKVGTITANIARKEGSIIERCISPTGAIAITHYEVLKELNNASLLKLTLETRKNSPNPCTYGTYKSSYYRRHPIWLTLPFNLTTSLTC